MLEYIAKDLKAESATLSPDALDELERERVKAMVDCIAKWHKGDNEYLAGRCGFVNAHTIDDEWLIFGKK
jgi:hypothetical protein